MANNIQPRVILLRTFQNVDKPYQFQKENEEKRLTPSHLQGPFYLLLLGYVLAGVSFLAENAIKVASSTGKEIPWN